MYLITYFVTKNTISTIIISDCIIVLVDTTMTTNILIVIFQNDAVFNIVVDVVVAWELSCCWRIDAAIGNADNK
jgi:hypothetical protein